MTISELRQILAGIPDDTEVRMTEYCYNCADYEVTDVNRIEVELQEGRPVAILS